MFFFFLFFFFGAGANSKSQYQPVHARSMLKAFAFHQWILLYHCLCKRTTKALIRLRECAVWSGPLLSAYVLKARFLLAQFKDEAWRVDGDVLSIISHVRTRVLMYFSLPWCVLEITSAAWGALGGNLLIFPYMNIVDQAYRIYCKW